MGDRDVGLKVKGISLEDGEPPAVQDLSFSVARGSLHMILGERGTGKSALLEALAGPEGWATEVTPDGTRVVWAKLEW